MASKLQECVSRKMSILHDEDSGLTQEQMLGKAYGMCRQKLGIGKGDFEELGKLIEDVKITEHTRISKKGKPYQVREHERKLSPLEKKNLTKIIGELDKIDITNWSEEQVRLIIKAKFALEKLDFQELQRIITDLKIEGYYKTVDGKRIWVESYERRGVSKKEEVLKKVAKLIEETGYEQGRAEAEIESQMKAEEEASPEFKAKQAKVQAKVQAKEEKKQVKIQTKEQRLKVSLDELQSLGMEDNLLINILAPVIKLIIKGMATGEVTPEDIARVILTVKNNKTVKEKKKKAIIAKIRTLQSDIKGLKSLHDFMIVHDLTKDQISEALGGGPLPAEIKLLAHEIAMKVPAPTLVSPTGARLEGVIEAGDIPLIAVQSSNVKGAGVFKNELIVQFHQTAKQGKQRNYRYKLGTPEEAREVFLELVNATSAGKWVWENIRGTQKGKAYFRPHKPTIGGTDASLIPYTVSGRSPVKIRLGKKAYEELSKELRKFKMAVKEPPTSAEAFTQAELHRFERKKILKGLKKEIPRAQVFGELRKMFEKLNVRPKK